MSRIREAFARAGAERRAAFIPFLTAGDPSPEATPALVRALERAGADVLELGVPFSDPIADGPVLQRSASRSLAAGTTLGSVFEMARRIREQSALALVLFTYVNPLIRYGVERAARDARASGFDALLMTDVPPEEAVAIRDTVAGAGLETVFLASPTSTPARMRAAAGMSSAFLYVVSRPGPTGERSGLPADLGRTVRRARRAAGPLPIAIGFGISSPASAAAAARLADGVIVGSALVAAAETAGARREMAVETLARSLTEACRQPG